MRQLLILLIFLFSNFLFAVEVNLPDKPHKLVVLGDSLTEGYGVARSSAFPALLEKKIKDSGKPWTVVNAGISGATTASGPSRMRWQLKSRPQLIILALGANDGLRGVNLDSTEKNLAETIEIAQNEKIKIVLAGMMLPPNYGAQYGKNFQALYNRLAKKYQLQKIPFLLEGVAGNPKLNLADGIHPNEKGHEIIADNVYSSIKDLL
ncbi:MAG: arylesterase [Pseudobdellovibrionaceae bacterium]